MIPFLSSSSCLLRNILKLTDSFHHLKQGGVAFGEGFWLGYNCEVWMLSMVSSLKKMLSTFLIVTVITRDSLFMPYKWGYLHSWPCFKLDHYSVLSSDLNLQLWLVYLLIGVNLSIYHVGFGIFLTCFSCVNIGHNPKDIYMIRQWKRKKKLSTIWVGQMSYVSVYIYVIFFIVVWSGHNYVHWVDEETGSES